MDSEITDREVLRPKQFAFAAMGVGVAVAATIFYFLAPVGTVDPSVLDLIFASAIGTMVLAIVGAYLIQRRVPEAVALAASDAAAVEVLYRRDILSIAALELPATLSLVGFLLTADAVFLTLLLPFYVVLIILFPTPQRVRERLKIRALLR